MKYLYGVILFTLALMAMPAHANDNDCTVDPNWTEKKILQRLAECKGTNSIMPDKEEITSYAKEATEFAKALGIAARELGLAVDDFVKTDAGKLTAALIAWKVLGDDIKGIVFGIPILILTVWLWFSGGNYILRTGEQYRTTGLFGYAKRKPAKRSIQDLEGSDGFAFFLLSVLCMIMFVVSIVHIIG